MMYLDLVRTPLPHLTSVWHLVHDVHELSWQSRAHGTKHISSMYSVTINQSINQSINGIINFIHRKLDSNQLKAQDSEENKHADKQQQIE